MDEGHTCLHSLDAKVHDVQRAQVALNLRGQVRKANLAGQCRWQVSPGSNIDQEEHEQMGERIACPQSLDAIIHDVQHAQVAHIPLRRSGRHRNVFDIDTKR